MKSEIKNLEESIVSIGNKEEKKLLTFLENIEREKKDNIINILKK